MKFENYDNYNSDLNRVYNEMLKSKFNNNKQKIINFLNWMNRRIKQLRTEYIRDKIDLKNGKMTSSKYELKRYKNKAKARHYNICYALFKNVPWNKIISSNSKFIHNNHNFYIDAKSNINKLIDDYKESYYKMYIVVDSSLQTHGTAFIHAIHSVIKYIKNIYNDNMLFKWDDNTIIFLQDSKINNTTTLEYFFNKVKNNSDLSIEAYYDPNLNNKITAIACITNKPEYFKSFKLFV